MSQPESEPLFTPSEHEFLQSMGALCVDDAGRTVLLGLTHEESVRYMAGHRRSMLASDSKSIDADYLRISKLHHQARFNAMGSRARKSGNALPE